MYINIIMIIFWLYNPLYIYILLNHCLYLYSIVTCKGWKNMSLFLRMDFTGFCPNRANWYPWSQLQTCLPGSLYLSSSQSTQPHSYKRTSPASDKNWRPSLFWKQRYSVSYEYEPLPKKWFPHKPTPASAAICCHSGEVRVTSGAILNDISPA